jgi:hypothetical protein
VCVCVCVKCRTFLHVYIFFGWNSVMQTFPVRGVQRRLWLLSFWTSSTVSYSREIKMFREISLVRKQICSASLTPLTANSSSVRTNSVGALPPFHLKRQRDPILKTFYCCFNTSRCQKSFQRYLSLLGVWGKWFNPAILNAKRRKLVIIIQNRNCPSSEKG